MTAVALRIDGGRRVGLFPAEELVREGFDARAMGIIIESGSPYARPEDARPGEMTVPAWVSRLYRKSPYGSELLVLGLAWRDEEFRAACLSVLDLLPGPTGCDRLGLEAFLEAQGLP